MWIRTVTSVKFTLIIFWTFIGLINSILAQQPCYQPGTATIQFYDVHCYGNGNTGGEWIVLEIVGSGALDLENYIIDDNNFPAVGVGNTDGHARFPGGRYNSVPAGTKICLYSSDLPPGYVVSSTNWLTHISEMVVHGSCPNNEFSGYDCPDEGTVSWFNVLALRNEGDFCQIRTPLGERIDLWECGDYVPPNNRAISAEIEIFKEENIEDVVDNKNLRIQSNSFGIDGDFVVCQNSNATLEAYGGISYEWFFNRNLISTNSTVTVTPNDLDEYEVRIELDQGCFVTEYAIILVQSQPEICDGRDNNCDGIVDNNCSEIDPEIEITSCSSLTVTGTSTCSPPEITWEYSLNNTGFQTITD